MPEPQIQGWGLVGRWLKTDPMHSRAAWERRLENARMPPSARTRHDMRSPKFFTWVHWYTVVQGAEGWSLLLAAVIAADLEACRRR
ncbi:hypothetical protein HMPREF3223_00543 [Cutibacterium avidum]|nr:hypothetical protein HMPREF3223_00543 [Cutibacterium avidum]